MSTSPIQRQRLSLRGQVQGVGMRPFVCRLAQELDLAGWVSNTPEGVVIEAEGNEAALARFARRLTDEAPPPARIDECSAMPLAATGQESDFRVVPSRNDGAPEPCVPPDLAPCADCLRELSDPADRRYRYPFLSCTACGPRYSIVRSLPFDRERTAMAGFALCPDCRREYENPADRRFHAQTTCCPACGPQLALWDSQGISLAEGDGALRLAVERLRQGAIVALKGVGGFQLLADAGNSAAVEQLRTRKHRPAKPFALLADRTMAERLCRVSEEEIALLLEPAAPIVLLRRRKEEIVGTTHSGPLSLRERARVRGAQRGTFISAQTHDLDLPHPNPLPEGEGARREIAPQVAPDLPWLGLMLPASPLHHLLLADFGGPLVATSGNRGGEPICVDENEALARLAGIADLFLVHDRSVLRPLDDSVLRIAADRPLTLRRARGYVPAPVPLAEPLPPLLAVGGHLKNTVALGLGRRALLSQHLGDLDDVLTEQQCGAALQELPRLFGGNPRRLAVDAHPDYASRRLAEAMGLPLLAVPHHLAHAMACAAEHGLEPPFLALAWDGIGLGEDGGLWGGEFLRIDEQGHRRIASFVPLRLPGGEKAVKEPRRTALAAVYDSARLPGANAAEEGHPGLHGVPAGLRAAFSDTELAALLAMLEKNLNTPPCSSVGRLFDAVSALLGLCPVNQFEGQAAMRLEAAAGAFVWNTAADYPAPSATIPLVRDDTGLPRCDWRPWLRNLLRHPAVDDADRAALAYSFHAALADAAPAAARLAALPTVVLCGGCFQNRLLLELCVERLRHAGFDVYWPQRIPPNDGGLALGQLWAARRQAPA
ncbi:carbamoyltransferase HypF [Methylogaea oryzae]|uniref:Carbamoyltransferase HypF n=2 Tax=Methylogaea oryzae TaxID=1295382 RepID=A0A8D4VP93_9GAMM|nr:carbamoyltransferase HypF [Methylogaea oryzae]BBL70167.1 carbamoyltransferase HypF [Methylogaea oryzae]